MILSVGTVVVRREERQWKYLFLRAYRNWDFPKGIIEQKETPIQAAKREVREETGITDLDLRWGLIYKETLPYYSGGNKIARYYIAETSRSDVTLKVNPQLGKPEHHEYRWVPYEELRDLAPERLLPIIEWANGILSEGETT